MTTTTYPDINSRTPRATNVVDATDAAETLYVSNPDATTPGTEITVVKGDASGNAVTVADGNGTLATLNAQNDAVTLFSDGVIWVIKSLSSSEDAGSVAAALTAHESETEAHGATGDVQGATDVATALAALEQILDPFGHIVARFPPGGNDAVNNWDFYNSETGGALEATASGTDTNISFKFNPKGTGAFEIVTGDLLLSGTPVALSTANVVADAVDSVEATNPTVAEFNALAEVVRDLQAALRSARVLDT